MSESVLRDKVPFLFFFKHVNLYSAYCSGFMLRDYNNLSYSLIHDSVNLVAMIHILCQAKSP